jgi:hypothetical protein
MGVLLGYQDPLQQTYHMFSLMKTQCRSNWRKQQDPRHKHERHNETKPNIALSQRLAVQQIAHRSNQ